MKLLNSFMLAFAALSVTAGNVEQTYTTGPFILSTSGNYQTLRFDQSFLSGKAGEPTLPYYTVTLVLPAGEVARSVQFTGEGESELAGNFQLAPYQPCQPTSFSGSADFVINREVYASGNVYPASPGGRFTTGFLNGCSILMTAFTPVKYIPATGKISYFTKMKITVTTSPDASATAALQNLRSDGNILQNLETFVQNPSALKSYPARKATVTDYQLLIITSSNYQNSFQSLIDFYLREGIRTHLVTTSFISTNMSGQDAQEKIRNYIIQEYQTHGIDYVVLGGDVEIVPYRGFYCHVQSSSVYEDDNIPSDLYYSALDGTWNNNGNNLWGEIGEDDLLPEVSVARMPFSNATELNNILNKTISYQNTPVLDELNRVLLAGEDLYPNPQTWGGDYLNLLIGYHTDNGYNTTGLTPTLNIEKLYDTVNFSWSPYQLMNIINTGKAYLYHVGHANETYNMRLFDNDITNSNFSQVNGTTHNFTNVYSHGCLSASFDYNDCIAEDMVKIQNFAASYVGNSRYGWFNEGTTEGPSQHLNREYVNALYGDKINRIGTCHKISRIASAPFVNAPGQYEEGALRWCFYDCNVLGDAAMAIWPDNPFYPSASFSPVITEDATSFAVTVNNNGAPAAGLTCAFLMGSKLYGSAVTDTNGNAFIQFDTALVSGNAQLYISGYNCLVTEYPVNVVICIGLNEWNSAEKPAMTVSPNPFSGSARITFLLNLDSDVTLEIFNSQGIKVKSLINNRIKKGRHEITWDGTGAGTGRVPEGIYFLKMQTGDGTAVQKIILK